MFTSSTSHTAAAVLWAFSLAALTQGKEFPFPVPTPADQQPPVLVAWSPKPTEAPRIRGRVPLPAVFARQTSLPPSWCGYANADESKPITCNDSRSLCLFNTIYHAVGCCPSSSALPKECAQYTSCVPSTVSCDSNCQINDYILKCSQLSAPNCYTYEWPQLYKNYGCGPSSYWVSVEVTYQGESVPSSSTTTKTSSSSSSSSSGTSTTSTSATSTGPTTSATTTASSSKSGTNIGAIAGGSVGGVAVIAAFVLGLVFLLRKKNRGNNSSTPPPPPPPSAPIEYSGVLPGPPMSPVPKYNSQYYDPAKVNAPALSELSPEAGTVQPGWPVQGGMVYEAPATNR